MAKAGMFRLAYGPWHRFDPKTGKALCGEELESTPGSGVRWATVEVRPVPKCGSCHEIEHTRGLRSDE